MRMEGIFKEENLKDLQKLGEGGQGQAYRLSDEFCLKLCRLDYEVGEVIPHDPNNYFTQTCNAVSSNELYEKWGDNEYSKLMICQHPNVVQVYLMVRTDKGNMVILLALAQSDLVSFYDGVIQQHKPPAFEDWQKEMVKEEFPMSQC